MRTAPISAIRYVRFITFVRFPRYLSLSLELCQLYRIRYSFLAIPSLAYNGNDDNDNNDSSVANDNDSEDENVSDSQVIIMLA